MKKNQIISLILAVIYIIQIYFFQDDNRILFIDYDLIKIFISFNIKYYAWFIVGVFIALFDIKHIKGSFLLSIIISTICIFASVFINLALAVNSSYFLAIVMLALSLRNTKACNSSIYNIFMMERHYCGDDLKKKINKSIII